MSREQRILRIIELVMRLGPVAVELLTKLAEKLEGMSDEELQQLNDERFVAIIAEARRQQGGGQD